FLISTGNPGPAANLSRWSGTSKHGVNITVQAQYRSLRREGVPTTAVGVATRYTGKRIAAGNPHPLLTNSNGFSIGTAPTCFGSPMMFLRSTTDGLHSSPRKCGDENYKFHLSAFPAPTV